MKVISVDNYTELLSALSNQISQLKQSQNSEVRKAADTLHTMVKEREEGGKKLIADNDTLRIGIVGQVKAGKSSFLNSLFFDGENVLPKASTPMTAGLTILAYGETEEFVVEYYDKNEWKDFMERAGDYDDAVAEYKQTCPEEAKGLSDAEIAQKIELDDTCVAAKDLVSRCSMQARSKIQEKSLLETVALNGREQLQQQLETYVGADGKYTSIVKSLTLHLNDPRLKGVQIVDTPGVNDPVLSREQRTKEFLRNSHGVFFLSYAGRFFDATDMQFLSKRIGSEGICQVVLIGSKFDSALQQEGEKYKNDLEGAIDHCRDVLENQFRNNIKHTDYSGKEPDITWVSAICYAIATKDPSKWDDTERHTLSRLQTYYPTWLGTNGTLSQDDRATLLQLSYIDIIKEDYLSKKFVANKEDIIKEKVNAYFANSSQEIGGGIAKELGKLKTKLDVLNSTDLNLLEEKKRTYNEAIAKVEKGIGRVVRSSDAHLKNVVTDTMNSASLSYYWQIPMECRTENLERNTTKLERDKKFDAEVKVVVVSTLCDQLKKYFEDKVEWLVKRWQKENETLVENIRKEFRDIITNAEEQTENFDADILRDIIDGVLMEMYSRIEGDELRKNYESALSEKFQGLDRIRWSRRSESEGDAQMRAKEAYAEQFQRANDEVSILLRSFSVEYKTCVQNAAEASKSVLRDRKQEFVEKVKQGSDEFLGQLEEQLKNKNEQKNAYEQAINILTKIKEER